MDFEAWLAGQGDAGIALLIRQRAKARRLRWTKHILLRLLERDIALADVASALATCEVVERYPADTPHPSALVLGEATDGQPLHVVCGLGPEELCLITAYRPDPGRWLGGGRSRKEQAE